MLVLKLQAVEIVLRAIIFMRMFGRIPLHKKNPRGECQDLGDLRALLDLGKGREFRAPRTPMPTLLK